MMSSSAFSFERRRVSLYRVDGRGHARALLHAPPSFAACRETVQHIFAEEFSRFSNFVGAIVSLPCTVSASFPVLSRTKRNFVF